MSGDYTAKTSYIKKGCGEAIMQTQKLHLVHFRAVIRIIILLSESLPVLV